MPVLFVSIEGTVLGATLYAGKSYQFTLFIPEDPRSAVPPIILMYADCYSGSQALPTSW